MKNLIFLAILWSSFSFAINNPKIQQLQSVETPTLVRVYFHDSQEIQPIVDQFDVWTVNSDQKFAIVYLDDDESKNRLQSHDLDMRIDDQLIKQFNQSQIKISQNTPQASGIPGYACYSTVAETFQRMDQMVSNYPNLATIEDIGDSWEKININNAGSDLRVLKITNQSIKAEKPILFTSSSIHAREYTTAELNTRFAEYLLAQYGVDPDVTWILDNHEIHLSLITNPDGREQAQTGLLWRKNTNQTYCAPNSNDRGVDLNRNYPFEWGIGGSSSECSETFRGPSAATEPEIIDQMNYLRQIFDDNRGTGPNDPAPDDTAGIFVDIHSYSQLVLWPWGYTFNNTPNDTQLQALGKRTAFFNQYHPQPVNELVLTGGGSIDATYGELGVASLAFELGTAFFQDCETFENTIYPDNLQALLYLARIVQAPYKQPLGPDIENFTVSPNVIISDSTLRISGLANDDRYNHSNGAQTVLPIQSVTAYLNQLPINSVSGQAMNPTDGNFDQVAEQFEGQLTTVGLTSGKNMLYVQASDGSHAGATYAQFIDLVDPNDVGMLTGIVTDALDGMPIANALLSINQSTVFSSANGSYQQYVQPGVNDLTISAKNYAPLTVAALNVTAGGQLIQNIQLQPFCELFNDDMESGDNGWQTQGSWAISSEQSVSPANAWSDSPGSDYSANTNAALVSPAINTSESESIQLSYMSLCDTEAGYDYGHVEVQFDNGSWQEISSCDGQSNWQSENHTVIIPANTPTTKVRFRLSSDGFIEEDGWYIDDVVIQTSGTACGPVFKDIIFIDDFE